MCWSPIFEGGYFRIPIPKYHPEKSFTWHVIIHPMVSHTYTFRKPCAINETRGTSTSQNLNLTTDDRIAVLYSKNVSVNMHYLPIRTLGSFVSWHLGWSICGHPNVNDPFVWMANNLVISYPYSSAEVSAYLLLYMYAIRVICLCVMSLNIFENRPQLSLNIDMICMELKYDFNSFKIIYVIQDDGWS